LFSGAMLVAVAVHGQTAGTSSRPAAPARYDVDYIGAPLPDPVMQQAKETYVSFGCAYCHGITLVPRGEAADLRRSPLVGADTNGDAIAALLRAGVPRTTKLSPMPQFSDLSDRQLHDIARYIHYARQERRYQELVESQTSAGDATAGGAYFAQQCGSCHTSDLTGIGKKYNAAALRAQLLRPRRLNGTQSFAVDALRDSKTADARQRHNFLLENLAATDLVNLLAYLANR
jgi:mono/diheme cytochrome c family protein